LKTCICIKHLLSTATVTIIRPRCQQRTA